MKYKVLFYTEDNDGNIVDILTQEHILEAIDEIELNLKCQKISEQNNLPYYGYDEL
jgi:hypothetical protein